MNGVGALIKRPFVSFVGRFSTTYSISLIDAGLGKLSISLLRILLGFVFEEIDPFHPCCQIYVKSGS